MSCCLENSDSEEDQKSEYRECTDVIWIFIFVLFFIPLFFIGLFAYTYGVPEKLVSGADTFGNICGSDNNQKINEFRLSGIGVRDKRFLFYMDYNESQQVQRSLKICVEKCPETNLESLDDIKSFQQRTGSSLCRYDFDIESVTDNMLLYTPIGPCPVLPIMKSSSIMGRCIPELSVTSHLVNENWNLIEEILRDLYMNWHWIEAFISFSFVLAVIIISMMYLFSKNIAWIVMGTIVVLLLASTSLLWWTYIEIKCKLDNAGEQMLDDDINNEEAFIWYSVIATIFTLVVFMLMFAIRKHVSFLGTLFREASNCLSELSGLFFIPVFSFLVLLLFYTFWISVVVRLPTASYPETKIKSLFSVNESWPVIPLHFQEEELRSYVEVDYVEIPWAKYMTILYAIGLIWASQFVLSFQHMVISSTVAQWYFKRNSENANSILLNSVGNAICYHAGSLAFGSLLLTLLKLPRTILSFIHRQLRKHENSNVAEYATTCCSCCLCWLEKFIRQVTHNAYTIIALESYNFCPAAYRAWKIQSANALKLTTVNSVSDFILFLAKCLVALISTGIAICVFRFDSNSHLYAASTLVIFTFAYFIAHAVISLYESVIDTLFLCVCQDHQVNGSDGHWQTNGLITILYRRGVKKCCPEVPPIELQRTTCN